MIEQDDPFERAQALLVTASNELEPLMDRVSAAHRAAEAVDELLRENVAHARWAGKTWAELGDYLGITRQAAQQRFATRLPGTDSQAYRRYLGTE